MKLNQRSVKRFLLQFESLWNTVFTCSLWNDLHSHHSLCFPKSPVNNTNRSAIHWLYRVKLYIQAHLDSPKRDRETTTETRSGRQALWDQIKPKKRPQYHNFQFPFHAKCPGLGPTFRKQRFLPSVCPLFCHSIFPPSNMYVDLPENNTNYTRYWSLTFDRS